MYSRAGKTHLMEATRRQVQGQVIKWRYFRQLEIIPQSSAQLLMKRQSQRKNRLCDKEILSQPMATPASCPNVSSQGLLKVWTPTRSSIKETSHCLLFQTPHFILKQSITRTDSNISWIMAILYKLQKSQEIGQPLPFLHENYHCS